MDTINETNASINLAYSPDSPSESPSALDSQELRISKTNASISLINRRGRGPGKKKAARTAVEIATAMGYEPIVAMIHVCQSGYILEPDGRQTPVETEERLKMLRELVPFTNSKAATEIHGSVEHRHSVDMTRIMMDPALAQAAESLALAMAEQDPIDAEFEVLSPVDEA